MKEKEIFNRLEKIAKTSLCKKMQFAAVIINNQGLPIGWGKNEPLKFGCCIRENIPSGTQLEKCYAIHAEQLALIRALESGYSLIDAELYILGIKDNEVFDNKRFYCTLCSRILSVSKLKYINLWRNYQWIKLTPQQILDESYGH